MPGRAPYRHRRNRMPRPSLSASPPQELVIAWVGTISASLSNPIFVRFSGTLAIQAGDAVGIRIVETDEAAIEISEPISPDNNVVAVLFATDANRIGMHIEFTQPTTGLSGVELPIAPLAIGVITDIE